MKVQSVRGMKDLLPGEIELWQQVEQEIREVSALYGYSEIRLPLLERTELFKRSIGEATDIVEKEMYTFLDNSDKSMTLRPEATASCVRAGIEHGLFHNAQPRLWYMGSMFRYERPQQGRYRQFHQYGIEAFGWAGPDIDAEIIDIGNTLWKRLKIARFARLQINSLGTPDSRATYRRQLVAYFEANHGELDEDSVRRLKTNPLRILDSKNPDMQQVIQSAPALSDYLSDESRDHFNRLLRLLRDLGIEYEINNRLVRGLDYYNGTVFEWVTDRLGAQNAICAGGRYDGLAEMLGGREVPGIGFAMGLERLVDIVRLGDLEPLSTAADVYLCVLGEEAQGQGYSIAQALRQADVSTIVHCGGGKLARQLRNADRLSTAIAIIIGQSELEAGNAMIKNLKVDEPQRAVRISEVVQTVKQMLSTNN
ncbi:MAG: histidine--tRNA ligase [Acidiferrobacterales bacterium]|nr:histidine--tRNA ligase [Acidiferrobacterales bacterium]